MRRFGVLLSVVVAFVGFSASSATAQTPDAVTVARNLIAAENAHNVTLAVSMFAPGAIVNLPTGPLATTAAITGWQQELAAGNFVAVTTTPVAVTPEVVTFTGTVQLDLFRGLGLAPLESTWQLTIQLGRVTTFNFDFTPAATARLNAAIARATGAATPAAGTAAPAAGTTARLALTGADVTPVAVGSLAIALGLLLVVAVRRREQELQG